MKKLILNKETVRSLNGPEMQQVVGGRLNVINGTITMTLLKSCVSCVAFSRRAMIVNPGLMFAR